MLPGAPYFCQGTRHLCSTKAEQPRCCLGVMYQSFLWRQFQRPGRWKLRSKHPECAVHLPGRRWQSTALKCKLGESEVGYVIEAKMRKHLKGEELSQKHFMRFILHSTGARTCYQMLQSMIVKAPNKWNNSNHLKMWHDATACECMWSGSFGTCTLWFLFVPVNPIDKLVAQHGATSQPKSHKPRCCHCSWKQRDASGFLASWLPGFLWCLVEVSGEYCE